MPVLYPFPIAISEAHRFYWISKDHVYTFAGWFDDHDSPYICFVFTKTISYMINVYIHIYICSYDFICPSWKYHVVFLCFPHFPIDFLVPTAETSPKNVATWLPLFRSWPSSPRWALATWAPTPPGRPCTPTGPCPLGEGTFFSRLWEKRHVDNWKSWLVREIIPKWP